MAFENLIEDLRLEDVLRFAAAKRELECRVYGEDFGAVGSEAPTTRPERASQAITLVPTVGV